MNVNSKINISIEQKPELEQINRQLKTKGFKLTAQREATVNILLEYEKDHLSAEEVYLLVKQNYPDIGLATVYRTLELLCELHVVEKVNFGDGVARYDLRGEDQPHLHHHLICTKCGNVEEIKEDWLLPLENRVLAEFGFTVSDHRLDFQGVCRDCNAKSQMPAV
ncbi:ferric iron uptake transcriptional regulator [Paenibacillus radicis (ex Gao et al. 2016)]|uniref:Transcriptional repressor n=1 Tax=Paenibacillus radicis (ex Gao et al. 2016) TaxID=1737354 RepID=A0A917HF46_9BACL|nr:Fur family transcriptional regulator [Paenibacillus radicis (ex Gao et al. 2016)]GGG76865.1 transcriptional repressor [Paenibacillus radicis (ex Gao et al. 2016)]